MQLRRFGLLLPLSLVLLSLATGCSNPVASPFGDVQTVTPQSGMALSSGLTGSFPATGLQPVEALPKLHTPETMRSSESTSEIIQTHYRPTPADPVSTATAKPATKIEFGRAANYEWLQGELIFSSVRGVWRLRYAAADDDDAYGGSVTLLDISPNVALQAGQRVRVLGRLINPRSTEPSPYYHVSQLETLSVP
ncbi:hypothetical protein BH10PLA2_BH10PLA2_40010 [soil metagenome]